MEMELDSVGLLGDPRVEFESAFRADAAAPFRSAGSHGCFLTHLRILDDAARDDARVLILQDDCSFSSDIQHYEPEEFDIFYGGYEASDPDNPATSEIVGAHFMGFSVKAARLATRYLRDLLDPATEPDQIAAASPGFEPAIRPPIDGSFVWFRRAHPELKTVFALLSYQRSSRSDITPSRFDSVPIMRRIAPIYRRLKRRLSRSTA